MKYLVLDSNIYINMIINRDTSVNANTHKVLFDMLADNVEVKLVVPEIVLSEVNRNTKNYMRDLIRDLDEVIEKMKGINWLNVENSKYDGRYFEEFVKELKRKKEVLKDKKDIIEKTQGKKIKSLMNRTDNLHIVADDPIISQAMKRKIFKAAPCHIKEEYGDAVVYESIKQMKRLVDVWSDEDQVYFITNNYTDFSAPDDKTKLHPQLQMEFIGEYDMELNYSIFLLKTLKENFSQEIITSDQVNEEYYEHMATHEPAF
ncbi:PIN domain-containing protein [Pontibacillus sp. HMF3514]|uniref:PIN domain-containing protein n=1 Tax=Pontibacillus sp. HMF3514 TaxID=2692425 RepID=UPI00131FE56B|nr:PIN domain-containing protein [Pontibacillus sp. HMF3514]QHE52786.1 DUF4935 domain-containing protein [Pontibacillus sp. HMF3514]